MLYLIAKWFIVALSLLLAAFLVPGIEITSFGTALIVAALMGIVNIFIRPILLLLTLPLTIITLGLFTFVINGFLFWFLASFVEGFEVTASGFSGLGVAILGALVVSVFSYLGDQLLTQTSSQPPRDITRT